MDFWFSLQIHMLSCKQRCALTSYIQASFSSFLYKVDTRMLNGPEPQWFIYLGKSYLQKKYFVEILDLVLSIMIESACWSSLAWTDAIRKCDVKCDKINFCLESLSKRMERIPHYTTVNQGDLFYYPTNKD